MRGNREAAADISRESLDPHRKWLIIAASSRGAAERFAKRHRLASPLILDRFDLVRSRGRIGKLAKRHAVDRICVHSLDWSRERMPQLYVGSLAISEITEAVLVDERECSVTPLTRRSVAAAAARIPFELATGFGVAGREILRSHAHPKDGAPARFSATRPDAVTAVWLEVPDAPVGGPVTHISGILQGFRAAGLKVALVSAGDPPPQLAPVVDDLEVIPPLPAAHRLTRQLEAIAMNEPVRRGIARVLARIGSCFIYQRHAPFLVAGLDVAQSVGVPFVLEWQGSEVWKELNWTKYRPPLGLRRFQVKTEERVAREASLVASVSEHSSEMAREIGAHPHGIVDAPNAVDISAVDHAVGVSEVPDPLPPVVGWIGSFGEFHGAEVLIRAIPHMEPPIRVVMVGDGPERPACQTLARDLGVARRVTWTGQVSHPEALRKLAACGLLASPHVPLRGGQPFFGSPTKVFEYMALARPIVASRLGQIGQVLQDGRTARLVTPGDPVELAVRDNGIVFESSPCSADRCSGTAGSRVEPHMGSQGRGNPYFSH